jgi:hypothetical protein
MKLSLSVITVAVLVSSIAYAQETPLKVSQVPLNGNNLNAFVPSGWKIEKQINGDLNRDKAADAALVLVRNGKTKDKNGYATARSRALIVALKSRNSWRRVGINNSLLMGTRDGGAFWGVMETPVDVSIKNGVLNVEQMSGSRETTETTHRFRYDTAKKRMYLIGLDYIGNDRATGAGHNVSTNFLTGVSIIQTMRTGTSAVSKKRTRVSTKLRPFESVRGDERYSA